MTFAVGIGALYLGVGITGERARWPGVSTATRGGYSYAVSELAGCAPQIVCHYSPYKLCGARRSRRRGPSWRPCRPKQTQLATTKVTFRAQLNPDGREELILTSW